MRKLIFSAAAIFLVLGVITFALPWLISSETVRSNLLSRAKEITGREMQFTGDPKVSFYPFLGIEIQDVSFAANSGEVDAKPILSMPRLKAKLSITSALSGKVVIDEFQFIRPKFNLTIFEDGKTNWAFAEGQMWQALEEASQIRQATQTNDSPDINQLNNVKLGRFIVSDGTIEHKNRLTDTTETVTNFDGTLNWPNVRSNWQFNGSGIWRGDDFKVSHSAQTPVMLLAGGQSTVQTEINSKTLNLSFDGEANRLSNFFLKGKFSANSPSLRGLIEFFGGQAGVGASFSNFGAAGDISGTLKDLQLENALIELDDNSYKGGLRVSSVEDATRISGTLAGDQVDLDPYFRGATSLESIGSIYGILAQSNLDIRLSASSIKLDGFELTDFAGGMIVKDRRLKLDIGNGSLAEGIVIGSIELEQTDEHYSVVTNVNAGGVNPTAIGFLENFSGIRPNGRSDVTIKLTSRAKAFIDLPNETSGSFSLVMKQGQLVGLDFKDIRTSLTAENAQSENIQIGNSPIQSQVEDLALNVAINRGVGWIEDSSFKIEEYSSKLSGKADLRSGNLAVWGLLKKTPQDGSDDGDTDGGNQFFLGGTISQPLYVPNIRSQIPSPTPVIKTPLENELESAEPVDGTN